MSSTTLTRGKCQWMSSVAPQTPEVILMYPKLLFFVVSLLRKALWSFSLKSVSLTKQQVPAVQAVPALKAGLSGFISDCWCVATLQASFWLCKIWQWFWGGGSWQPCFICLKTPWWHKLKQLQKTTCYLPPQFVVMKPYSNACMEHPQGVNRSRRTCCNLTVHRHYTWGLEMSESKNITCTNELSARAAQTKWPFPV